MALHIAIHVADQDNQLSSGASREQPLTVRGHISKAVNIHPVVNHANFVRGKSVLFDQSITNRFGIRQHNRGTPLQIAEHPAAISSIPGIV